MKFAEGKTLTHLIPTHKMSVKAFCWLLYFSPWTSKPLDFVSFSIQVTGPVKATIISTRFKNFQYCKNFPTKSLAIALFLSSKQIHFFLRKLEIMFHKIFLVCLFNHCFSSSGRLVMFPFCLEAKLSMVFTSDKR